MSADLSTILSFYPLYMVRLYKTGSKICYLTTLNDKTENVLWDLLSDVLTVVINYVSNSNF